MENDINQILIQANDSTTAIRQLYFFHKENRPSFSLRMVCEKVGIKSSGYLSDVVHGKRLLNVDYANRLASVFKLTSLQKRCFISLLKRDHLLEPLNKKQADLQIKKLKKSLAIQYSPFTEDQNVDWFRTFHVYSAIGVFAGGATKKKLEEFLTDFTFKEISDSLLTLIDKNLIVLKQENYHWTQNTFLFEGPSKPEMHARYFKSAIEHSLRRIPKMFPDRERALFMSQTISVSESKYKEVLSSLRADLLEVQSDLETGTADNLVFFNVQIYPYK